MAWGNNFNGMKSWLMPTVGTKLFQISFWPGPPGKAGPLLQLVSTPALADSYANVFATS